MEEQEISVYLFIGFLESGKTTFLQGALSSKEMDTGERTALIVFEEGEEEYNLSDFKNITMHVLSKDEMTLYNLLSLQKKGNYERIFVEYNGMWELGDFFDAMPDNWGICQIMAFADCTNIINLNNNMRQLVFDKFQYADLIVFNRYKSGEDKLPYHKLVRAISRNNEIIYENEKKEIEKDDIIDPLPFDINAPTIEIEDRDYAYFYRELTEKMEEFDGKTVRFKCVMAYDKSIGTSTVIVGRHVMTCCAADTKYCGLVCQHDGLRQFKTGLWCILTAKIKIENNKIYGGKGPVLTALQFEPCKALVGDDAVSTFY